MSIVLGTCARCKKPYMYQKVKKGDYTINLATSNSGEIEVVGDSVYYKYPPKLEITMLCPSCQSKLNKILTEFMSNSPKEEGI